MFQSKIKHDNSVDVDKLSKMTIGFSGADLENMVNTAAIRAAGEVRVRVLTVAERAAVCGLPLCLPCEPCTARSRLTRADCRLCLD